MNKEYFKEFIDKNRDNILNDLSALISIPSINGPATEEYPLGEPVAKALDFTRDCAKGLGLEAENLGHLTEIKFGDSGETMCVAVHADVVPVGDGWDTDPFELVEKNGKLYGRGTLDDKGPAIAAIYALAAVKSTGAVPKKQIRLLVGGEEETGMNDVKKYVEENGLPDYGLTPDGGFPIINAELGVLFSKMDFAEMKEKGAVKLLNLTAGRAFNCVPDSCECTISVGDRDSLLRAETVISEFAENCPELKYDVKNNKITLSSTGVSAHGSVPWKGKSALYTVLAVLKKIYVATSSENAFVDFCDRCIGSDDGKKLGIYFADELSGTISTNCGMCGVSDGKAFITFDIRVPVSASVKEINEKLKKLAAEYGAEYTVDQLEEGIHVSKDSAFMQSVASSYEKATGKKAEFLCERGSTYAKSFGGKGVAFGPIDEKDPSAGGNLHTVNEYIDKEALFELAVIYAVTLYDFCCM